jgi:hypothetical protein
MPAGRAEHDKRSKPSPEKQTAELCAEMPDWEQFVADIQKSRTEWAAHRATGKPGLPPGWVTRREHEQRR